MRLLLKCIRKKGLLTMKKSLSLLMSLLMTMLLLAGCSAKPADSSVPETSGAGSTQTTSAQEKTTVNVFALKGPTGVGMVNLMKANDDKTAANDYQFRVVGSPDEITGKIASGEADIAAVPTNLAAVLYKKTSGQVKMLAVNTMGVLYMVENGDSIASVKDLKGKTIYTTGQGANPEYTLKYILEKNGLDPEKDVRIEFVSENDELAALLANGTAKIAMVPEPAVTSVQLQNKDLRVALDMTEEWDKVADNGGKLLMGCVIARTDFIEQHPEAVEAFLTEYKASIEKCETDLDGSAALCETYEIIPKAAVAKKAIPGCNLTYIAGSDMKQQIGGYFEVLLAANLQSVGGALPDDAFYYKAS